MRKLVTLCVCLLLIAALATTAFAATGFAVSASGETLKRGDSVTLTFSVSSDEAATSYGLLVDYDKGVFELIDGNCNVPGALINSFQNGFAFMFQQATAYSGTVGTMTLKVKEDAALGSYKISGVASVKNGSDAVKVDGCSVELTVTGEGCSHSYGNWSDAGDGKHSRTCTLCQNVQTASHSFENGWSYDGQKHWHACKDCGFRQDEQDHVPGADASHHCVICNGESDSSIANVGGSEHPDTGSEPTKAEKDEAEMGVFYKEQDNTVLILAIILGSVAVLTCAVTLILRMRRK